MSAKGARRLLWVALMLFAPVPFMGIAAGWVPVLRLLLLGSLFGAVALQDPDTLSQVFTAMFLGQGLVWAGVLYGLARLVVARLPGRAAVVIAAALALMSLFPIYTTPFSSSGTHGSILQIFD